MPRPNPGWFRKGHDPRRHILTQSERRKGGINCARKYTIVGAWPLDWVEAIEQGRARTQLATVTTPVPNWEPN